MTRNLIRDALLFLPGQPARPQCLGTFGIRHLDWFLVSGFWLLASLLAFSPPSSAAPPATAPASAGLAPVARYFAIEVVDEQTGRGVPLVELATVSGQRYWTDSAGLIALDDPALMGRRVYFHVRSHGYEHSADGFGFRGAALDVVAGASARLKLKRSNVAERLYRVTGEGIYRDSVLLGRPVPIRRPLLNAQVAGQDSAQVAVYGGKIYWFWGDTNRLSYPLGHFGAAGATSPLPGRGATGGGLDPSAGVDLDYFTDADGFSRPTLPRGAGPAGHSPAWLDALMVVKDSRGADRLLARCSIMKSLGECVGRKLVAFDDRRQVFEPLIDLPLDAPLGPFGQTLRAGAAGPAGPADAEYLYFPNPFPNTRVRADWDAVRDLKRYEAFTPLAAGTRYQKGRRERAKLDRDAGGKLAWAWKADTGLLDADAERDLIAGGLMREGEAWFRPRDVQGGKPLRLSAGSVHFNAYRRKYVMIATAMEGGTSFLGEVYYAEADRPEGPWPWARKIVTHDRYSFYNPTQHPFFDQEGGRVIYFEGTYANTFSGNDNPTPRYDYNQIMYKLDLSDPRLKLPTESADHETADRGSAGEGEKRP